MSTCSKTKTRQNRRLETRSVFFVPVLKSKTCVFSFRLVFISKECFPKDLFRKNLLAGLILDDDGGHRAGTRSVE